MPESSVRFYALRMRETGMIKSSPQGIIAAGTDWRFLDELKRELKELSLPVTTKLRGDTLCASSRTAAVSWPASRRSGRQSPSVRLHRRARSRRRKPPPSGCRGFSIDDGDCWAALEHRRRAARAPKALPSKYVQGDLSVDNSMWLAGGETDFDCNHGVDADVVGRCRRAGHGAEPASTRGASK